MTSVFHLEYYVSSSFVKRPDLVVHFAFHQPFWPHSYFPLYFSDRGLIKRSPSTHVKWTMAQQRGMSSSIPLFQHTPLRRLTALGNPTFVRPFLCVYVSVCCCLLFCYNEPTFVASPPVSTIVVAHKCPVIPFHLLSRRALLSMVTVWSESPIWFPEVSEWKNTSRQTMFIEIFLNECSFNNYKI